MKKLYLYISQSISELCNMEDIFCFRNNKVIGIDTYKYDKLQRKCFQQQYSIYPYSLSQTVLKEILLYSRNKCSEFLIVNIDFLDDSINYEEEYMYLNKLLMENNSYEMYSAVMNIIEEFDTDIHRIAFKYEGYDISLSSEGVLSVEAPEKVLSNFFKNDKANKLILGLS